jgi:FkbM family methyltransferase
MKRILLKIFNRIGMLSLINTTINITFNNKKFTIPIMGNLGFNNLDISEPWMSKVIQHMRPLFKGSFVDVGVNVGQTLIKAYAYLDNVKYVGFEPNPKCIQYVQVLSSINKFQNCEIIPVGVSDETRVLKLNFYSRDETDQSASIINDFRPAEVVDHYHYVPIFNSKELESFLPDCNNAFLKIDVEGAELNVLKGLKDWIRKNSPIIFVEILPVYESSNTFRLGRQNELEKILKDLNYSIFRICKNEKIEIRFCEIIGIHGEIAQSDYILCPTDMNEEVIKCFG